MKAAAISTANAPAGSFPVRMSPALVLAFLWCAWTLYQIAIGAAAISLGDLGDTDNHMHLAQWRDFLFGQDWFDLRQHRFVGPEGGDMHFSRLPDALMTALYVAASPFLGAEASERFVLLFYPPLLHLGFLAVTAMAGRNLAGARGAYAAIVLAMLAPLVAIQFAPGRIDHHGLALALSMGALAFVIKSVRTPRAAAPAAILATLAAAISLETAPAAAAAFAALVFRWIVSADGRALRFFGAAMFAAAPATLFATLGGDALSDLHCDMLAAPAACALAGAGAIALALSFVKARGAGLRLCVAAVFSAALALLLVGGYPNCLGGPFEGMDPLVREVWLAQVGEARSPFLFLDREPAKLVIFFGFPLAAMIVAVLHLMRAPADERMRLLTAALFLAFALPPLLVAVRGAMLATIFAILPFAAFLAAASKPVQLHPPKNLARFLALFLCAAPTSYATVGFAIFAAQDKEMRAAPEDARGGCDNPAALHALRALPASLLFTPVDLGPAVLTQTDHSVTAAPYHRNHQSIRRAIEFFTFDDAAARAAFDRSGAAFVVYCPTSREALHYAERAPNGLAARLGAGSAPAFLSRVDLPGAAPIEVYRRASP